MITISFNKAFQIYEKTMLVEIDNQQYSGFFIESIVSRKTLPKNWFIYDLVTDSNILPITELRNGIATFNRVGSFCSCKKLPLRKGHSLYIDGGKENFEYRID